MHVWCICVFCLIYKIICFWCGVWKYWISSIISISISTTTTLCCWLIVYARHLSCAKCHIQAKNEGTLCTAGKLHLQDTANCKRRRECTTTAKIKFCASSYKLPGYPYRPLHPLFKENKRVHFDVINLCKPTPAVHYWTTIRLFQNYLLHVTVTCTVHVPVARTVVLVPGTAVVTESWEEICFLTRLMKKKYYSCSTGTVVYTRYRVKRKTKKYKKNWKKN